MPIQTDDARNILAIQTGTSYIEQSLPPSGVTYYYGVTAVDRLQNESPLSNVMGLTSSGVVAVEPQEMMPKEFVLHQNYPNPFNPSTAISFQLAAVSFVTLKVYDVLGREVVTLVDGIRNAGSHTAQWNASGLSSGMYICRLTATDGAKKQLVMSKKMLLVK
jgi:fibronectin type 3 domain-containing protein